jgi:hypothetical protein
MNAVRYPPRNMGSSEITTASRRRFVPMLRNGNHVMYKTDMNVAVLRVCGQIYEEGSYILRQGNMFVAIKNSDELVDAERLEYEDDQRTDLKRYFLDLLDHSGHIGAGLLHGLPNMRGREHPDERHWI